MQRSTSNAQLSTLNKAQRTSPFEKRATFDLEERLLRYSATIIRLVDELPAGRAASHVAGQLLRAGTAALPNHGEAQAAESAGDFVHKMRICLKELRESRRWLRLIKEVPLLQSFATVDVLIDETDQLVRIFSASIRTALKKKATAGPPNFPVGR
jgi:four helix bundle protein